MVSDLWKMALIVRKITIIQGGIFWLLRNLWRNLHLFLDILDLKVENKN